MLTKIKIVRNISTLLFGSFLLASMVSAQAPGQPCDTKTLGFYPLASMQALFSGPVTSFGISADRGSTYSGTCNFVSISNGNAFVSALVSNHASREAADLAFQKYKEGVRNPPELSGNSCDRYIDIKSANDSAGFQSQKGSYTFIAIASLKSNISPAKLKTALDYACSQAPGTKADTASKTEAAPVSSASPTTNTVPTSAPATAQPLLFGIVAAILLVVLSLILWMVKRSKKSVPPAQY